MFCLLCSRDLNRCWQACAKIAQQPRSKNLYTRSRKLLKLNVKKVAFFLSSTKQLFRKERPTEIMHKRLIYSLYEFLGLTESKELYL